MKPKLSIAQIWNMSFGFLGIQFGFALQNANVSRIFEQLGADIEDIPILWVAAPLTGLIIQPIVGYLSDKTWTGLGRRRPYFLVGAIMASLALFIMPNSPVLWVAAGMLWIMDASINISMEPFRAFVGDNLPDSQRTTGFAMQSFFIGTGAVIASALPYMMTNWFGIDNTAIEGAIPSSVKWSFYLGGAIFFLAVLYTVLTSKEYSPEQLKSFEQDLDSEKEPEVVYKKSINYLQHGLIWFFIGAVAAFLVFQYELKKELYILGFGALGFGMILLIVHLIQKNKNTDNGLYEVMEDLFHMPKTMAQLAVVQFFSWFALFSLWIYSTAAVTSHIYHTSDTTTKIYNEGADWVGVLFAVYNGAAALLAFVLPVIARATSRKTTHMIALMVGGVSFASIYFFSNPDLLWIPMIGIGLAWASILSMPYAILTGALPSHKMGVYMGIFNFFIVIPQIIAASLWGFIITTFFDSQPIWALVSGGVSLVVAGLAVILVEDKGEEIREKQQEKVA